MCGFFKFFLIFFPVPPPKKKSLLCEEIRKIQRGIKKKGKIYTPKQCHPDILFVTLLPIILFSMWGVWGGREEKEGGTELKDRVMIVVLYLVFKIIYLINGC